MDTEGDTQSVDYSSAELESEVYLPHGDDGGSLTTAQMLNDPHSHNNNMHNNNVNGGHFGDENDVTSVVHEMHLALLYLLSNPEEFQRALATRPIRGATTLNEWNAEYEDNESLANTASVTERSYQEAPPPFPPYDSSNFSLSSTTPLPFVVFADDAEVVLPAAHTASQLFGVEKVTGMELEAAAGLPALSQLFLRWLALMPGGDHLNLIDPPGLTVMRIAGGRYRVTAAHRVVWTWMNDFPNLDNADSNDHYGSSYLDPMGDDPEFTPPRASSRLLNNFDLEGQLHPGDLVSLTIVDVFETDNQGKLLSYCPTFDNRAVSKTNAAAETLRKSTAHLAKLIGRAQKSYLARRISFHATQIVMALKERVEEAVASNRLSPLHGNHFSPHSIVGVGSGSVSSRMTAEEKKESNSLYSGTVFVPATPSPGDTLPSSTKFTKQNYSPDAPLHEV